MKRNAVKFLAILLALNVLMAAGCPKQNTEDTQIKLTEIGIVINKTINESVKGLREARANGLVNNENYVFTLRKAEASQKIADSLNKQLDRWGTIDGQTKAPFLDALALSASEFDKLLSDPDINLLPANLRDNIRKFVTKAKGILSIAAGVVGIIEASTKTTDVTISLKGVK